MVGLLRPSNRTPTPESVPLVNIINTEETHSHEERSLPNAFKPYTSTRNKTTKEEKQDNK